MKIILVKYQTHADKAIENEGLIHGVFHELRRSKPAGLQYNTFKQADGSSFVHLALIDRADGSNPLLSLDSFKRFQLGLRERCEQAPVATELFSVDSYPMP